METSRPSVFTPFMRRFTDERGRDQSDTIEIYQRVRRLHDASRISDEGAAWKLACGIADECSIASKDLAPAFVDAIHNILSLETPMFEFPQLDLSNARLSLKESVDLRHFLRAKEYFLTNELRVGGLIFWGLKNIFGAISELLPESHSPSPFTIPLIFTLPEPKNVVQNVIAELWKQEYVDSGFFVELSQTIHRNFCRVSGIVDPQDPKKPFKLPSKSDAPLQEIVSDYLGGTPFYKFFNTPVPLRFTHEDRYSHMHVLGGSGAGKTQLLQNLILHDLQSADPPSLVVVDSQGDLIDKLLHLDLFDPDHGPLSSRLILITPKDTQYPPALNIFDVNRDRLGRYDEATKEQVVAGVIQTFDYLFAGLLGADLTAKQGVFFRFVARLMLALPATLGRNATILDMIALMDDATPYEAAIATLPPIQRTFFNRDFKSKTFAQTKEQIRYRLNAILENPTLARLFTQPNTKLDLFSSLNRGSIVLVDTAKDFLKGASPHFGRIFISLVLQAILERAVIPEGKRTPTFLVVDEAAAYFDGNIDDFLTEARKYRCGCVFAHQFLDQPTPALRASLAANTSIKMAGGVSTSDARALASDMRTSTEFILSQPRLHFASYMRGVTPNAVSIPVAVGKLESQHRLTDKSFKILFDVNRKRVGASCNVAASPSEHQVTSSKQELSDTDEPTGIAEPGDSSAASNEW
jgi:hypothetical protein